MGKILFVEPESTINLLFNPSIEAALTNITAEGSTRTRSLEEARFGRASVKVVTDGLALQEGVRYRHAIAAGFTNTPLTASVYARGSGRVRLRIDDVANSIERVGRAISLRDDFWTRLILTTATGAVGSGNIDIYLETIGQIQAVTFYADAWQLENKGYPTTYEDGDLERALKPHDGEAFFKWEGARHESSSTRSERYREGGRLRDVAQGLDFEIWPTNISGFGMPRMRLQTMSFDTQDEVLVQRQRPRPRALSLTFWASKLNRLKVGDPASLRTLHKARQALENLIKPDLVQEPQPLIIRYEDGSAPMDLAAYFETGMEFSGDIRNPYQNQFSTRFFVPDPLWKVDSQDQCELTDQQLVAHDGLLARIDGEWQGFDVNATGLVRRIAVHPISGDVYVAGTFTEMDGDANCNRICRFTRDGSAVAPLATGIDDGDVYVITFLNDGRLVVGGSFTNIGAVAHNNVAIYDPDTDTWSTMGPDPGLDSVVQGAAASADGDTVYLGGQFTESFIASVTPLNKICEYSISGDDFSAMTGASGNGVNDTVQEMIMDMDGTTLLFVGSFTQETGAGADTLKRVAIWDGSTFAQMGLDGAEARVRHLAMTPNGHVYVAGDFTNIGFNNVRFCAVWNRTDFFPLGAAGDGLPGGSTAFGVAVSAKGQVIYVGDFTGATGIKTGFIDGVASWNGTRFGVLDFRGDTVTRFIAVAFSGDDIWLGGDIDGNAKASVIHTCTNNGKAKAGPILDVLGPCDLIWLENQSTGQVIQMQFEVLTDEEVLIDLRPGHLSAISSFRGNVIADILPDSNRLVLLSGDNTIAFLADGTTGDTEHVLHWQDRHWSFDD
jgi:WD40 repeat protein